MIDYEMPIGFGMALAQNPQAMQKFAALNDWEKQAILNGTHNVTSKSEMKAYVERLTAM